MSFEGGQIEPESHPPPAARPGLPWEQRAELGPASALTKTIGRVMLDPSHAFRAMRLEGNWAEPLGFGVLVGSISLWIYELWGMVLRTMLASAGFFPVEEATNANTVGVLSALFAPAFVCFLTLFFAGMVHLMLMMFSGSARSFLPTFKVFCYSWSVGVLSVIPVCGVFAALVWLVIVWINGIREAHEVSTGQAAGPIVLLMVMVCFCWMFLIVLALSVADLAPGGLQ